MKCSTFSTFVGQWLQSTSVPFALLFVWMVHEFSLLWSKRSFAIVFLSSMFWTLSMYLLRNRPSCFSVDSRWNRGLLLIAEDSVWWAWSSRRDLKLRAKWHLSTKFGDSQAYPKPFEWSMLFILSSQSCDSAFSRPTPSPGRHRRPSPGPHLLQFGHHPHNLGDPGVDLRLQ